MCPNPYILKEPYISAKEPQYAMHQRQLHVGCNFAKAGDIPAKEPYISAKEPDICQRASICDASTTIPHSGCNFAKANDTPAKKPYMGWLQLVGSIK